MTSWEIAFDANCVFGESPNWDERTGSLVWLDMLGDAIHVFDLDPPAHRSWASGPVMSVLPRRDRGFAVVTPDGLALLDDEEPATMLAVELEPNPAFKPNDAFCDDDGRLWTATVSPADGPPRGVIWRIDPDLTAHRVAGDIAHGNGLGLSPDRALLYHSDSRKGVIEAYPFDAPAGALGPPRVLARVDAAEGVPDGLAVDADGGIWVALYRGHLRDGKDGSELRRYAPTGRLEAVIDVPVRCTTSCAFGGPDLGSLFVTTGNYEASEGERGVAGSLLVLDPGVAGSPPAPFGA